jgi:hypothetical protein
MPKIQRKTQKIFCNSADSDQIAVFGSMSSGTPVYSNDVEELQSNEAYSIGWDAATLEDKAPFMEEMNAMQYCLSYQLAYTLQTGIPEWDAETEYFENTSFCQVNGVIYQSKTNNNIGNNPTTDSTNWGLYGGGNYLTTSQITNCLLEVPQNIKLELNNGTLTLKAGSKIIVPNGANVFDEVTISAEKTRTWTYNGQGMMFYRYDTNVLYPVPLSQIHSGTTAPTGTLPSPTCWYDTTNNKVKITSDKGATWIDTFSFPLCLLTANGTKITSIDQVFNGFGYIGNTIFCDKGIKGLIPNGRNVDGTLENTEFTTISVLTQTRDISGINKPLILRQDQFSNFGTLNYNENTNFNIDGGGNNNPRAIVGTWSADSTGRITLFKPKLPVHLLTWDDIRINNPYFFGQYIWSEFAPDNLSWLKSSGQWNSGSGYQAFYDWVLANANANKAGFKLSTASYTDYDFVVNTSAKTFRLPKKVQNAPMGGTAPVVGNGTTLGLTNGTNNYGLGSRNDGMMIANTSAYGDAVGTSLTSGNGTQNTYGVTTDPNNSGLIADLSKATNSNLSLYFYIGETTKDPALINASQIASTYAEKLDKPVTYVNGTSGCRIWQDGFKEQWGKIAGANVEVNITFLQPFSNTDYTLTFGIDTAYNNWIQAKFYGSQNRTTTGFTSWSGGGDHTAYKTWYACGY